MTQEIRFGIIGSGFMGRTYAQCLAHYTHHARLVAVAGGSRAPQLAQDYGVALGPTITALIERPDIDALIITTPEMVHLEETRTAAAAGKHILVEKPMAPDVAQCQAMIDACDQANTVLMVVQSQRFRQVHQQAHALIAAGRIGQVQQIRHWGFQPLQNSLEVVKARPFYLDEAGGGLFMGYTVHSFDMVRWMAGAEAASVFAQVRRYGQHHIPNLSTMANISFENGVMAQLWANLEMPGQVFRHSQFRTQIVGEKGLLDFDGYTHLDLATGAGWETVWRQPPLDPMDPLDPVRLEAYSNMVQEFIDAVRHSRPPGVTGRDGQAAVELCQAALQSSQLGQVVRLPLSHCH